MNMDAEAWVAVGFIAFILLAVYFGGHKRIGAMLDTRGEKIRDELAQAERMRREAADILASFEGKRAAAEKEAAELVAQARVEAELIAKDAEAKMGEFVARRTAQAEAKIANAEVQALAQVHAIAADAAAAAAERVLKSYDQPGFADELVRQGIDEVKRLAS
jgi:F-type H+-transporting ATPase subunit b